MMPTHAESLRGATGAPGDAPFWRRPRHLVLLTLALLLYVVPLFTVPLLDPDEGRYGEIPREMLASGDYVTPRLDGTLYFEKPPLHYWLTASALRLLGNREVGVRFWTALFGLGTAGLLVRMALALAPRRTAWLAGGLLLASPYFFSLSHVATLDMTLTFFVTLALVGFWMAQDGAAERRRRLAGWAALFGGSALAVLAKGLVGIVLPGGVIFFYLLLSGRWRLLREVPWVSGTMLLLAVAVPWHVLVARRNPSFVQFYFVHEHFLRYTTPIAERGEPFWYFFAVLAAGCLPWIGLLGRLPRLFAGSGFRRWREENGALLFLFCWIGFVVLFYSTSHSKLAPYVLPAAPPLALLAAMLVGGPATASARWSVGERVALGVSAAIVLSVGAAAALATTGLLPASVPPLGEAHALHPWALLLSLAAAAAGGALLLRSLKERPGEIAGPTLRASALLCAALWALVAIEGPTRSSRKIADLLASRLEPGDRVVCFGGYRQSLPFYLERFVESAEPHKDLAFGVSQLSPEQRRERFPTVEELKSWWESDRRVYVVVDRQLERLRAKGIDGGTVLLPGKRMQLVVNHPPRRP